MYDKTVRRRRAVLVLLVAISLGLLTAYFGEPPGGRLHGVQGGFLTVLSPVQDGANKALKPVRDLLGWVGDTLHARSQRDQLRKQLQLARSQGIQGDYAQRELVALQRQLGLDRRLTLSRYSPVNASVIGRSPNVWFSTIQIDRGSSSGVHVDDPVIDGDGLVGTVSTVASDGAVVKLITDSTSGVSALVNATGAPGIVQPEVGNPTVLLLQDILSSERVRVGDDVVTSGTISDRGRSLFPPLIPIGKVTKVDNQNTDKAIEVRPFATLRRLDTVQVLNGTQGVHAPSHVSAALAGLAGPGKEPPAAGGTAAGGQTASTGPGAGP